MRFEPFTPDRLLSIAVEQAERAKGMSAMESYELCRDVDKAMMAACWMEKHGYAALPSIGPFVNWLPKPGDYVRLGVGAEIKSYNKAQQRILRRSYKVRVHHIHEGNIYRDDDRIIVRPVEIVWAGSGGYWCWTTIHNVSRVDA